MRVAPSAVQIVVGDGPAGDRLGGRERGGAGNPQAHRGVRAVSGSLAKVPAQTWREYGPLFDAHSTAVVTPELLAALAQVESSGNPVARTYWRWRLSWNPFELYRPASSAVGMFQITDGTFAEARRYCIHDNVVVEDGPWHDLNSCWFNALYTRVVPGHAVEMTAALLDRSVARILARHRITTASLQQRQDLAAIIHLCGAGAGDGYARRGFRFRGGQRCGDHDPSPLPGTGQRAEASVRYAGCG